MHCSGRAQRGSLSAMSAALRTFPLAAALAFAACSSDGSPQQPPGDADTNAGSAGTMAAGGDGPGAGTTGGTSGAAGAAGGTSSGGRDAGAIVPRDDAGTMPDDGGSIDAGSEPLDPAPGEYGLRAELLEANSEMAVAEVNGKVYVLGGYPSSRQVQTTVQVYDPATDTWELGTPLPLPLHHPVIVGVAGKLHSFGGQTNSGDTNRTLVYDPEGDRTWRDLRPMPTARGAGAAAVIGDVVYVVGGRPPAGNAFEAYDIGEDTWTPLPDLPQTFPHRNHLAAAAIAGKVYVAGGRHSGGSFADPLTDSLDVYDPAMGAWQQRAPMLRPRGGNNGIAAFGCFHVWGGEGANIGAPNNVFPDHDVYDPIADRWTRLADLPTPVHGVTGAAFLDGLIYMPGGGTRQGGTSGSRLFQVYRPAMRCE
jgi:N-acetylneuraminic acid mutarotase